MAGIPNKIFTIDRAPSQTFGYEWVVASGGAATIKSGTPAKRTDVDAATATGAVLPMADGDGNISGSVEAANGTFAGLAKQNSTDTAAAAGVVDLWFPAPGIVYRGFAKSASAATTQTAINVLMGKRVIFDLTTSDWTVDSAAADALLNCVIIVGGLPQSNELLFVYDTRGSVLGRQIAVTS